MFQCGNSLDFFAAAIGFGVIRAALATRSWNCERLEVLGCSCAVVVLRRVIVVHIHRFDTENVVVAAERGICCRSPAPADVDELYKVSCDRAIQVRGDA